MLTIRKYGDAEEEGVPLLLVTPELRALNESWYARADIETAPLGTDSGDDYPVPDPVPAPPPELGKLFFPVTGAQRWARGDFLIAADDYLAFRTTLGDTNKVTLSFRDADTADEIAAETPREFTLYILAGRPLVENALADETVATDAVVITLVDVRYYWQFSQGIEDTGAATFASWTALFSALGARLGAAVTISDPVNAAYLTPTTERWGSGRPTGVSTARLLDAAATFVGSRIVVGPDGAVYLQRPTATRKATATTFHAANTGRHVGGGLVDERMLRNGVPENVQLLFTGDPPVAASASLASLTLPDYAASTGEPGYAWGWADAASTLAGASQTAMVTEYATSFYEWQTAPLDALYAGFTTVPLSGFIGHLEYYHTSDEGLTAVKRLPENYGGIVRGRPLGGDCCGWSADYYTFGSNRAAGGLQYLVTSSQGISGITGGGAGPYEITTLPSFIAGWTVLTWKATPFNTTGSGRTGIEVTVPANETHRVDAQIHVAFDMNTITGDWNTGALAANTHRCHLLYIEAAVFDLGGGDYLGIGSRVTPWLPVVRGQVVNSASGMVPTGDRVPYFDAGFDPVLGSFRGQDNAPRWAGTATAPPFIKNATSQPGAVRYGWVIRAYFDTSWVGGNYSMVFGGSFWTTRLCCSGTTPATPTPPVIPSPGPPDRDAPPTRRSKRDNPDELFLLAAAGAAKFPSSGAGEA